MNLIVLAVLAAAALGGGFGQASAEVDELTATSMIIDLEVEVKVSADAVVAHLSFDDDPTLTMPLLDRGGGVFGVRTELEPKNYMVVFEAVGSPGEVSESISLTRLGADIAGTPGDAPPAVAGGGDDQGLSRDTQRMGWLALALAAASLSALAFWALGDRERPEADEKAEPIE